MTPEVNLRGIKIHDENKAMFLSAKAYQPQVAHLDLAANIRIQHRRAGLGAVRPQS